MLGVGCEKKEKNEEFTEKEFFKFSDFGCEDIPWYIKPGYANNHYVITTQQELEKHIEINCIPQIDFDKYFVVIGSKSFTTGVSIVDEKVEENNIEVIYTITFLTNNAAVALGLSYHIVIKKTVNKSDKNIEILEIIKQQ